MRMTRSNESVGKGKEERRSGLRQTQKGEGDVDERFFSKQKEGIRIYI